MRSSIAISAAIATFATSAFAANCNPSYNVAPSTECYTACNVVSILNYPHYMSFSNKCFNAL